MGSDNLIHIKIGYDEAVESKKNILSSELNLLKILRKIKAYRALRLKELDLKLKIYKKLKETRSNIRKLQTILPKVKIPEELKKREEKKEMTQKVKRQRYDSSLESELQDIQEKLRALSQ